MKNIGKEEREMNKQKLYVLIASAVGVLSTLLPWASVGALGFSKNMIGLETNGIIALIMFVATIVLCYVGERTAKFDTNFIYAIWGMNAAVFIIVLSIGLQINQVSRVTSGLSNLQINQVSQLASGLVKASLSFGAYLALIVSVLNILLTIEQLDLVSKIETIVKNINQKK